MKSWWLPFKRRDLFLMGTWSILLFTVSSPSLGVPVWITFIIKDVLLSLSSYFLYTLLSSSSPICLPVAPGWSFTFFLWATELRRVETENQPLTHRAVQPCAAEQGEICLPVQTALARVNSPINSLYTLQTSQLSNSVSTFWSVVRLLNRGPYLRKSISPEPRRLTTSYFSLFRMFKIKSHSDQNQLEKYNLPRPWLTSQLLLLSFWQKFEVIAQWIINFYIKRDVFPVSSWNVITS